MGERGTAREHGDTAKTDLSKYTGGKTPKRGSGKENAIGMGEDLLEHKEAKHLE